VNDRLDLDHLSPTGEEVDRAQQGCAVATWDADSLADTVRTVFQISPSRIEAIPCVSEILRDLQSQVEPDPGAVDWISALQLCKAKLETNLGKTESQARLVKPRRTSGAVRMMTARFSGRLSSSHQKSLRGLRARVVLVHLSNCQPISDTLGAEFARLAAGKSPAARELCGRISNDRHALIEARKQFATDSREAEFITSLLGFLDGALNPPPIVATKPSETFMFT
jgi:hypothetical protein